MNWHTNKPQGGVESDFQIFSIIKMSTFQPKITRYV